MKSIFLLLFLTACASGSEWTEQPIAQKDQDWRWCEERLDGPEYADKGWCWQGTELKKHFFKKDEVRTKIHFCASADTECQIKNDFKNKKVVSKEGLIFLK